MPHTGANDSSVVGVILAEEGEEEGGEGGAEEEVALAAVTVQPTEEDWTLSSSKRSVSHGNGICGEERHRYVKGADSEEVLVSQTQMKSECMRENETVPVHV